MGCDISLRLEIRRKEPKIISNYITLDTKWKKCNINGRYEVWSDRIYNMFAKLSNVKNYFDKPFEHNELRGFPDDANIDTKEKYYYRIVPDDDMDKYDIFRFNVCPESDAKVWIEENIADEIDLCNEKRYITNPDYHSANWCTTKEMEQCVNEIFYNDEEGWHGDYEEWVALVGAMKGYESTGEYECRAVFWFD